MSHTDYASLINTIIIKRILHTYLMEKRLSLIALCLTFCIATISAQRENIPVLDKGPDMENYLTPSTEAPASPDEEGFIRRWTLLEPIVKPNRSNTVFTDSYLRENLCREYIKGQAHIVAHDGEKVRIGGEELTWHKLDSRLYNVKLFRFATGLDKAYYGIIFLATTVVECSDDIPDVRLSVGSNSASVWWINGEERLMLSGDRRMVADDAMSERITLRRGQNIIHGAIINGPGMSDFCVRFVDEYGKPVRNFRIR